MKLKRIVARALAVCMLIASVPITAFAGTIETFTIAADGAHSQMQFGDTNIGYSRGGNIELGDGYWFGINTSPATMSFYVHANPGFNDPSDVKVNGADAAFVDDHYEIYPEDGGTYTISMTDGDPIDDDTEEVTSIENKYGKKASITDLGGSSRTAFYEDETVVIIPTFGGAYPSSDYHAVNVIVYGQTSEDYYDVEAHCSGYGRYPDRFTFTMPDEPVSVCFDYEENSEEAYNVYTEATPDEGGYVSLNCSSYVYAGENVSFYVYPSSDYSIESVTVCSSGTTSPISGHQPTRFNDGSYEFTMPEEDVSIVAKFTKAKVFDIKCMYNQEAGMSCIQASKYTAEKGETVHFSVFPEEGYYVQQIVASIVDSATTPYTKWEVPLEPSNKYGYDWMYTLDHAELDESLTESRYVEIYGKFVRKEGLATATVFGTGEVTFTGDGYQEPGKTVYMQILPGEGYRLTGKDNIVSSPEVVLKEVGTGLYSFVMPSGGVFFLISLDQQFSIDAENYDHLMGSVLAVEDAYEGETVNVSVTGYDGFEFKSISVETSDGTKLPVTYPAEVSKTPGDVNVFSFKMPSDNAFVSVDFVKNGTTYDVMIDSLEYLDPSMQEVLFEDAEPFDEVSVEVLPAAGLKVKEMTLLRKTFTGEWVELTQTVTENTEFVEGRGWVSTYSFKMPNGDVMLHGSFEETGWALNVLDSDCINAYVDEAKPETSINAKYDPKTANYGDTIIVTVTHDTLDIPEISVKNLVTENPVTVTPIGTDKWMFTMPDASVEVQAVYEGKKFNVTAATGLENGEISVSPVQSTASYGKFEGSSVITVITAPADGYEVKTVTAGALTVREVTKDAEYEFDMPVSDVNVSAEFQETIHKIVTEGSDTLITGKGYFDDAKERLNKKAEALSAVEAHTDAKKAAVNAAKTTVKEMIGQVDKALEEGNKYFRALEKAENDGDREAALLGRTNAEAFLLAAVNADSIILPALSQADEAMAIEEVNVKFDANGGSTIPEQWLVKNGKAVKPSDPSKTDYTFDAWYADASLTTRFDFNMEVDRDITIFAKWNAKSSGGSTGGGGSYSGGSSTATKVVMPAGSVKGTWTEVTPGVWTFATAEKQYKNEWAYVYNPYAKAGQHAADWFWFNENGVMLTGWQFINGKWYWLNPNSDGTLGACLIGPAVTPDGHHVDETGARID